MKLMPKRDMELQQQEMHVQQNLQRVLATCGPCTCCPSPRQKDTFLQVVQGTGYTALHTAFQHMRLQYFDNWAAPCQRAYALTHFAVKFQPLLAGSTLCAFRRLHVVVMWKLKQFMLEVSAQNQLHYCRCHVPLDKKHSPMQCIAKLEELFLLYSGPPPWMRETHKLLASKLSSSDVVNHILSFAYYLA